MEAIRLQGIGWCHAIPAKDLKPGMTRVYNYGITETVSDVKFKGKSVYVTVRTHRGQKFTQRKSINTLVAVQER